MKVTNCISNKTKRFSEIEPGGSFLIGQEIAIKIPDVLDVNHDFMYNAVIVSDGSLYGAEKDECFKTVATYSTVDEAYANA
jgi:hypothetical protein